MIKKKCKECGTVCAADHEGECPVCTEDRWANSCEDHPKLDLGDVSECSICKAEREIEEYSRKEQDWEKERRQLERKIKRKEKELERLNKKAEEPVPAPLPETEGHNKSGFLKILAFAVFCGSVYVAHTIIPSFLDGNRIANIDVSTAAILIFAGFYASFSVDLKGGKEGRIIFGKERSAVQMLAAPVAALAYLYWGWSFSGGVDWHISLVLALLLITFWAVHMLMLVVHPVVGLLASLTAVAALVYPGEIGSLLGLAEAADEEDSTIPSLLWEFETGDVAESSPAIGSDGTVYVGSWDNKLYAINGKTGVKLWEFETGDAIAWSSPAIGSDGTVYVGSRDKKLYAIKTESLGLAKSPWPMRGQNARHTGRVMKK